jgi:hypothetical protein
MSAMGRRWDVRLGWKVDIARGSVFGFCWLMRLLSLVLVVGAALTQSAVLAAEQLAPSPVCQVARDAAKLIGKRVRVEGYVWNLSSHGFVLTGKRRDCKSGQLGLWTKDVADNVTWRSAFATSLGPKKAILVGTVRWQQARFSGGRNPALTVERVEYLSPREADLQRFLALVSAKGGKRSLNFNTL